MKRQLRALATRPEQPTPGERLLVAIERAITINYKAMTMRQRREVREATMEAVRRFFDDRIAGR